MLFYVKKNSKLGKLAELEIEKLKLQILELSGGIQFWAWIPRVTQIHAIRDVKKEIAVENLKLSFRLNGPMSASSVHLLS